MLVVYVTFPDVELARLIADNLLNKKLISCCNIFPNIESLYQWENKIEHSVETIAIMKTTKSCYKELEQEIKKLHEYSNPCIIAINIEKGEKNFLKWIETSVKSDIT